MRSTQQYLENELEEVAMPYAIDTGHSDGFVVYVEESKGSVSSAAVKGDNYEMNFEKFGDDPEDSFLYRLLDNKELNEIIATD